MSSLQSQSARRAQKRLQQLQSRRRRRERALQTQIENASRGDASSADVAREIARAEASDAADPEAARVARDDDAERRFEALENRLTQLTEAVAVIRATYRKRDEGGDAARRKPHLVCVDRTQKGAPCRSYRLFGLERCRTHQAIYDRIRPAIRAAHFTLLDRLADGLDD